MQRPDIPQIFCEKSRTHGRDKTNPVDWFFANIRFFDIAATTTCALWYKSDAALLGGCVLWQTSKSPISRVSSAATSSSSVWKLWSLKFWKIKQIRFQFCVSDMHNISKILMSKIFTRPSCCCRARIWAPQVIFRTLRLFFFRFLLDILCKHGEISSAFQRLKYDFMSLKDL